MPKLLSRSKHEEFKSNSALQTTDQKERREENAKKLELQEIWQAAKFSQVALFILRNFLHAATVHHVALFMSHALFTILLFDVLTHFVPFLVFFQICPL